MLLDAPILASAKLLTARIAYLEHILSEDDERLLSASRYVFADEQHADLLSEFGTPEWLNLSYLYPCSEDCALIVGPCPRCPDSPGPASRLPRKPWRAVWGAFLDAVRTRIVRQLVRNNSGDRLVYAMGNGFVLGHDLPKDEWTVGWEYRAKARPLICVHLQIHLVNSKLIIQPILLTTPYIPLHHLLPSIPQGTPLTLLPYPTPAYFQTTYSGPTSALNAQFTHALAHLACDRWEGPYVVVYIPVENTHGEEKGLSVIYPQRLCLAAVWTNRPFWTNLPALPAQLQPSPVMQPMVPPSQSLVTATANPPPPSSASALLPLSAASSPQSQMNNVFPTLNSPLTVPHTHLAKSFVRAHRVLLASAMMKTSDPLDGSAAEVSGYVDFVAKEREKERERLRESRGRQMHAVAAPTASSHVLTAVAPLQGQVQTAQVSAMAPQTFYPSPPTNPPSVGAQGPVSPGIGVGVGVGLPQIPQGLPLIAEVKDGRRRAGLPGHGPISVDETKEGTDERDPEQREAGNDTDVDLGQKAKDRGDDDFVMTEQGTTAPATTSTAAAVAIPTTTTPTMTTTAAAAVALPPPQPPPLQSQPQSAENEDSWMGSFGGLAFDDHEFRFDGFGGNGAGSSTGATATTSTTAGGGPGGSGSGGGMDVDMDELGFGSWGMTGMGGMGMDWDMNMNGLGMGMGWMDQDFAGQSASESGTVLVPGATSIPSIPSTSTRPAAPPPSLAGGVGGSRGGMDFEADFTDDDFSFFDRPAEDTGPGGTGSMPSVQTLASSSVLPHGVSAGLGLGTKMTPGVVADIGFGIEGLVPPIGGGGAEGESMFSMVPGDELALKLSAVNHPTPIVNGSELIGGEPLLSGDIGWVGGASALPLVVDVELENEGMVSAADTQIVSVSTSLGKGVEYANPTGYGGRSNSRAVSVLVDTDKKFSPIPFAASHRVADGKYKYASGKFAFTPGSGSYSSPSGSSLGGSTAGGSNGGVGVSNSREGRIWGRGKRRWSLPSPPGGSDGTDESDSESDDGQGGFVGLNGRPPTSTVPDVKALVVRDVVRGTGGSSNVGTAVVPSSGSSTSASAGVSGIENASTSMKTMTLSWRFKYDRATDPRIGVVKKLIGVKRKSKKKKLGLVGVARHRRRMPKWLKEWEKEEGWGARDDGRVVEVGEDADEEDDDEEEGEEGEDTDDGTGTVGTNSEDETVGGEKLKLKARSRKGPSRPMSPLPEYLPPGPTLLATQFKHASLLPLSSSVRNTGSMPPPPSSQHTHAHAPPLPSVPTPVSPAAVMGAAVEKAREAEAAASMFAREVVENCSWADAWGVAKSLIGGVRLGGNGIEVGFGCLGVGAGEMGCGRLKTGMGLGSGEVWPADVGAVKELLDGVTGLEGPLSLGDLYETEPTSSSSTVIHALDPPHLAIGKSGAIIHVLPSALRFWEKLGLGPKGGRKNVTAFVLFEDEGEKREWRQHLAEEWLASTVELYRAKQFGNMVHGTSTFCQKEGLVALRYDSSFRKTLAAFIASLPVPQDSFVFFLVTPLAAMSLASTMLCELFSAIKKAVKTYSEAQILFHFVSEAALIQSADPSSPLNMGSELLCCSVYNRILQPVDRVMSRRFFDRGERVRNYFQVPAFTLARSPTENKVSFVYTPNPSLDVMDRHTLLHVGYQVSQCGKWILAACIDQRGEAHDLGVWLTQAHAVEATTTGNDAEEGGDNVVSDEMYVVGKVLEFALQFVDKANVEWRVVFSKLGAMDAMELDAWTTHLSTALHSISMSNSTPIHVSVMAVESSAPWVLLPSLPNSPNSTPTQSTSGKGTSRSGSSSSKSSLKTQNQVYIDTSMTTYALYQKLPLPISVPPTQEALGLARNIVIDVPPNSPNGDDDSSAHNLPLLPLSSSTLVRVPSSSAPSASSTPMIHLHLLHAAKSYGCSYPTPDHSRVSSSDESNYRQLLVDITQSFYSLSVLSCERWHLVGANPLLPFHLAAVEAMSSALYSSSGCQDALDS